EPGGRVEGGLGGHAGQLARGRPLAARREPARGAAAVAPAAGRQDKERQPERQETEEEPEGLPEGSQGGSQAQGGQPAEHGANLPGRSGWSLDRRRRAT